ncbi:VOC family protein [Streptomyces sp. NPDC056178]|uniref:VOC family protein n=1 Tax=unclassified Streptomyces TaxID=2593676 RepID=UPI0035D8F2DD
MSTLEKIRPVTGAPCWVNLMAQDLRAAQSFHTDVIGWKFRESILGSNFSVALACGEPVAGIGCCSAGGPPAVWAPYFAVKNADETAVRIGERGATLAVGPLPLGEGRVGIAADRDGAVFGFWEGPGLFWSVGRGSAPARLDLQTRDAFEAAIFYAEIFDWAQPPGGCTVDYAQDQVLIQAAGDTVATLRGGGIETDPDPRIRPPGGSWTSVSSAASRPRRPPLLPGANPHRFPHSPMSQTTPSSSATPMAPSLPCPIPDDSNPPLAEGRGRAPSMHTGRQPPSPPLDWTGEQTIGEGRRASRQ